MGNTLLQQLACFAPITLDEAGQAMPMIQESFLRWLQSIHVFIFFFFTLFFFFLSVISVFWQMVASFTFVFVSLLLLD